jgi:uncharacterized membrane protein YgdD (TMEM256/DUF423 family)
MRDKWIGAGGLFALLAVAFGAFGAHGLESRTSAHLLDVYKTGTYYQLVHALAIVLVAMRAEQRPGRVPRDLVCGLLAAGIVLFSGSLYVLAITGVRSWGAVTPLGGLCFLAGWSIFTIAELVLRPVLPIATITLHKTEGD